jgi:hypothetical protein
VRQSRRSWRSFLLAGVASIALTSHGSGLHGQAVSLTGPRAALEGTWQLEEWHFNGQVLRPPQVNGRWSNHDGAVLFMVHRTTSDGDYSQFGYGTYQMDASTWSYDYAHMETSSGPSRGPAQVTTERRDRRSFKITRQGSKIILTLEGPGDDRREYDGALFTLIQNGQVVRKWRRIG